MPLEPQTCYDCESITTNWVLERRQTSGGDGIVYSNDFEYVPVHANRRVCQKIQGIKPTTTYKTVEDDGEEPEE